MQSITNTSMYTYIYIILNIIDGFLSGPEKVTVFAPTDAAFAKLPAGTVDALLKDIPKLTDILKFHVVKGVQKPNRNGRSYETLLADASGFKEISCKVTVDTGSSLIYGGDHHPANVVTLQVPCDNGMIVVIDQVLLPYEGTVAPVHN